jgi:hypothetical protein
MKIEQNLNEKIVFGFMFLEFLLGINLRQEFFMIYCSPMNIMKTNILILIPTGSL